RRRGGPRATGRPAASVAEWKAIKTVVLTRAGWRCQACGAGGRLDVHHLVKRAQGGSDFDLDQLVALCRRCHALTDAPYGRGRLVVPAGGGGRFACALSRPPPLASRTPATGRPAPGSGRRRGDGVRGPGRGVLDGCRRPIPDPVARTGAATPGAVAG